MKNSAVAYDIFEDEYSDAQDVPEIIKHPVNLAGANDRTEGAGKENSLLVLAVPELSSDGYKITLKEPIAVLLEGEHHQYIAYHERSRISGQGPDVSTALRDFEQAFISVFLSYNDPSTPFSSGAIDTSHI